MSFLLRLCLGLMVLVPSLAHAQPTGSLEIPGNGVTVSGVGVISGWKCEAEGDITIRLNDGDPIPATYGLPRADTSGVCGNDGNNGFFSYTNWGNLGDGTHTAVAYDNGEEFGRSTFTVVTFGTAFLTGASGECRIPDFPMPGESTLFEWNQATQHLEAVSLDAACMEELTLESGEMCSSSIPLTTPLGDISLSFTFAVDADGQGCISGGTPVDGCYLDSLPAELDGVGISIMKNTDGSWTIESFPLGECKEGLTVEPGGMCSFFFGDTTFGDINGIFSINAEGQLCVEVDIATIPCLDTDQEFESLLDGLGISGVDVTKNTDGSWTIISMPTTL